nr:hypothetical protein [Tanacetum cinerariifolium]
MSSEEEKETKSDFDDDTDPVGVLIKSSKSQHILGQETVEDYYKKKFVYDRYYLRLLNRKAQVKIIDMDIVTRKGPIVMKIYKDDGINETIQEFKKKRKDFDNQDYFISNKRYKESLKFDKHLVRIVLNELVLGLIYFNDSQKQDFISVNDFDDFNDEALYNIQQTFFRFHQGPRTKEVFPSAVLAVQKLKSKIQKKEFQYNEDGNSSLNDVDLLLRN